MPVGHHDFRTGFFVERIAYAMHRLHLQKLETLNGRGGTQDDYEIPISMDFEIMIVLFCGVPPRRKRHRVCPRTDLEWPADVEAVVFGSVRTRVLTLRFLLKDLTGK